MQQLTPLVNVFHQPPPTSTHPPHNHSAQSKNSDAQQIISDTCHPQLPLPLPLNLPYITSIAENSNVDVSLKDCENPAKVLSKWLIKSLAGSINKFTKQYQQLHEGRKSRLYNICYAITHLAAVYKMEEYKQFVKNQPYKAFKPPEDYLDTDSEPETPTQ